MPRTLRTEMMFLKLSLKKTPLFISENSLQSVRQLGGPAAHVATPQEPRRIYQVILLSLWQGVPDGVEQGCFPLNYSYLL